MQASSTLQDGYRSAERRVVVSVVSHGQGDLLQGLLTDMHAHWNPQGLRLVVTQNLPEDTPPATEQLAFPTQVIRNHRPLGFAANHNAAFEVFDSDIFCVLNPDIRCPGDPMPALLRALAQPEIAVAAPVVKNPQGTLEDNARRRITPWRIVQRTSGLVRGPDYAIGEGPVYPDWVAGMFMALHSADFRRLGGFDERYRLYCEDADLCMRLWATGRRVVLVPDALAVHDARRESHRKLCYLRWHVSSLLRFFVRYPFYRPGPATKETPSLCRHP